MQPSQIANGEMRDYQLAGLNFLVNMHNRNLGMILGDEMGLVRDILFCVVVLCCAFLLCLLV